MDYFEMLDSQAQPVRYSAVTNTSFNVDMDTAENVDNATQAFQDDDRDPLVVVGESSDGTEVNQVENVEHGLRLLESKLHSFYRQY